MHRFFLQSNATDDVVKTSTATNAGEKLGELLTDEEEEEERRRNVMKFVTIH